MREMGTSTTRRSAPAGGSRAATLVDAGEDQAIRSGRSGRSTAAVVLAACAALAPACASATHERGFTPGGVAAGASAAAAAASGTPLASGAPAAGAPAATTALSEPYAETIDVAPGLQVRIEWPVALQADKAAMVKAYGDTYVGQWRAVGSLGKDHSFLAGTEEPATGQAATWVDGFVSNDYSARGLARLHSLRVASVSGRGAEIDACVDESGVRLTDRAGIPVTKQPTWTKPPRSTWFQAVGVHKGGDGTWRVKLLRHADYPHELAKECLR
jgi:hypothetical protein